MQIEERIFGDSTYTIYGADFTINRGHTVVSMHVFIPFAEKLESKVLVRGTLMPTEEGKPKDKAIASSHPMDLTTPHVPYTFHRDMGVQNRQNLDALWNLRTNHALKLLVNQRSVPFVNGTQTSLASPKCYCGGSMIIEAGEIRIYSCETCKIKFFWHGHVRMLQSTWEKFKQSEEDNDKAVLILKDPKGVTMKVYVGSCTHAWVPQREGKECPTCFGRNITTTRLKHMDERITELEATLDALIDSKEKSVST